MPYIPQEQRTQLDPLADQIIGILGQKQPQETLGELNYLFSRILSGTMGKTSYTKIAMATGVLENVKQELYRRMAEPYEDLKISQNGDIREYQK